MTDNDVKVTYKANADFSALYREALKAKAALAALNKEQAAGNRAAANGATSDAAARKTSTASIAAQTAALAALTRARKSDLASARQVETALTAESKARTTANKAARDTVTASNAVIKAKNAEATAETTVVNSIKKTVNAHKDATTAYRNTARAADSAGNSARRAGADMDNAGNRALTMGNRIENTVRSLLKIKASEPAISGALSKIGAGLSKLSVAFVPTQLVGAIVSLVGLINPLVAGIGALGAAAIGTASSLGTLAGAAVGLVPALSAALGVAVALKTALSGVGGAIKAGVAASNPTGGSKSPSNARVGTSATQAPYQLTEVEKVTRAQQAYARSIQDVKFAEQNLFDARKQYTRQVQDLTEAIEAYNDATKQGDKASIEQAQQNYNNILADGSATKADKDAARAAIAQAKEQQEADARQNQRNVEDRQELTKGGMNNNQSVVDAQRAIQDARNAQRDAQLALEVAQWNQKHPQVNPPGSPGAAGGAGAAGTDAFAEAMKGLAPAAQEFVKWFLKFRDAWTDVQKAVQQAFFEKFVGDLNRVYKILPSIRSMLVDIAGALGKVVDKLLIQVTSASWAKDFVQFGKDMQPVIKDVGDGVSALLDAFKDLTMAAMPFLQQVVHWLAQGSEHFAAFIKHGRDSGSIAGYLENVFNVMKKWWEVIKNVSATLYNYGKAAGPFGQWLTDGLVKMTKAWRDASEAATMKGSPFQKYLLSIEPMLTNIKGMFGDFFKWWAKTSEDPKNIKAFNQVVTIIRKDLGPALGRLLDTLGKSGLIEDFVKALSSAIDLINTLLKSGVIKGLKDLYHFMKDLFDTLNNAAKSPIGKFLANTLIPPLVVLAGLSFAFGPLFTLFGWLLKLSGVKGVFTFLGALGKGLGVGGGAARAAGDATKAAEVAAEGGKAASTAAKAAKAVPLAARAGEGAAGIMKVIGSVLGAGLLGLLTRGHGVGAGGKIGMEEAAKGEGAIGGLLKSIFGGEREVEDGSAAGKVGKAAGKAGMDFSHLKDFKSVEGLGGKLFLGYSAYDAFKMGAEGVNGDNNGKGAEYYQEYQKQMEEAAKEKDPKKRRALYAKASGGVMPGLMNAGVGGALLGAVDGGTIGGEIAPGVGILPGAIIGAGYGAVTAGMRDVGGVKGMGKQFSRLSGNKNRKDLNQEADDLIGGSNLFGKGKGVSEKAWLGISGVFQGAFGGGGKNGAGKGALGDLTGGFGKNWDNSWKPVTKWFTDVAKGIAKGWNGVVKWFTDTDKAIGKWWHDFVVKPFQDLVKTWQKNFDHNFIKPAKAVIDLIGRAWDQLVVAPFQFLIKAFQTGWNNLVVKPFKALIKWVGDVWNTYVVKPFKVMIAMFQVAWDLYVVKPFKALIKAFQTGWDNFVIKPFKLLIKWFQDGWDKYIVKPFTFLIKAFQTGWNNLVIKPFGVLIKWFNSMWDKYVSKPFGLLTKALQLGWDTLVTKPFNLVTSHIKGAWDNTVTIFKAIGTGIGAAWDTMVVGPIKKVTGGIAHFIGGLTKLDPMALFTRTVNSWLPKKKPGGGNGGVPGNSRNPGQGGLNSNGSLAGGASSRVLGEWGPTISKALKASHSPASWAGDIATIIQHESSGDRFAENSTDINAQRGDPSIGLMQLTGSNFRSYGGAKYGSQTNGYANIMAGIAYIKSRYGNPGNTKGLRDLRATGTYSWYSKGGAVAGAGDTDSVKAMLTPGEFVLNKKIVSKLGLANLNNLNSGVMDFQQALLGLLQSNAPLRSMPGAMADYGTAPMRPVSAPSSGIHNTFGDINIYNPSQERASDSLPRTVRKLSYLHTGR